MLAVITADVVYSSKAAPELLREAQQQILTLLKRYTKPGGSQGNGSTPQGDGELYRGDGLQIALRNPQHALNCALELGTALATLNIQLTLSLAIGAGQLGESVGVSQGSVFVLSGRGLDSASRGQWKFSSDDSQLSAEFGCAVDLIGFIISQLTAKQAEVLHYWLTRQRCDQQSIASGLGMTRQNVSLHWRKAAGPHLARCLEQFEIRCKTYLERSQ